MGTKHVSSRLSLALPQALSQDADAERQAYDVNLEASFGLYSSERRENFDFGNLKSFLLEKPNLLDKLEVRNAIHTEYLKNAISHF